MTKAELRQFGRRLEHLRSRPRGRELAAGARLTVEYTRHPLQGRQELRIGPVIALARALGVGSLASC